MNDQPTPEQDQDRDDYIPQFSRRRFDKPSFLNKLKRFAGRLGRPAVQQLYALYYLLQSPHTPRRSKMIIVAALAYFVSPIDSIPDLLLPLGFTDDLTVIALAYSQVKAHLNEDIRVRAKAAARKLLPDA